jgi:TPR repeat protein
MNVRERRANMLQFIFRNRFHLSRYCSSTDVRPGDRNRHGLPRRRPLSAAGFLVMLMLIGGASFAANDVSGEPHAVPAVKADEELGALLFKVEQQISTGRAFVPADDNALDTWARVVQRASLASPEALRALTDFVARARSHAADENAAGRTEVSIDLTLFEDLGATLLARAGAASASPLKSQAATSEPAQEDHTAPGPVVGAADTANRDNTASSDASASVPLSPKLLDMTETGAGSARTSLSDTPAPDASPAMGVADMNTGHLAPATGKTALAAAIPATRLATTPPTVQEQSMAAIYASRGDAMLAIKDISAARKFYDYAANGGSARAAMALAETYDPAFLTQLGAVGVRPDPALAANWYRTAAALGAPDAEVRLHTLSTQAAK